MGEGFMSTSMNSLLGRRLFRLFLLICAVFFLGGCAKPVAERVLWPMPPNEPRLEWLGVYYNESSFPNQSMMAKITGEGSGSVFQRATDVASNGKGQVYVTDILSSQVKVFDFNAGKVTDLARGGVFKEPVGVAVDGDGRIYVADAGQKSVLVYSPEHQPLFSFGGQDLFDKPAFLAVNDRLGRVYVTDSIGHKIVVFNKEGRHLFTFGRQGFNDGDLYVPQGIAINAQDQVFVADMLHFKIQVFDAEGQFLYSFGSQGVAPGAFEMPKDVAIDSEGHVYVTDTRKAAMLVFTGKGEFLLSTGMGKTGHAMGYVLPAGIAIDGRDRIFVVDQWLGRITEWQYLSGRYLQERPLDSELLKAREERLHRLRQGGTDLR